MNTNINRKSTIYVVTHCESCYNKRGIFTGRVDSVLTKDGHAHAELLAKKLRGKRIDVAYTSPLKRTKQTLKHILKYHPETKVIVDGTIIERDYGELSRKNKKKYEREYPDLYPRYHRSYDIPPPGGESIKEVERRILYFIEEVLNNTREKNINVLIVTHGNTIRPIRRFFEKLSVGEMMKLGNNQHTIFEHKT